MVPLDAAEHVRPGADDEVGARVDGGVREAARVARFSPYASSTPTGVWVASRPSAPAWIATTTTSASAAACRTSACIAGRSVSDAAHG